LRLNHPYTLNAPFVSVGVKGFFIIFGCGFYLSPFTSIFPLLAKGPATQVYVMALILVIDDDGFYRALMERALIDQGHRVIAAENGIEGIASYRDRHPDLTITDMRMPCMGGGEVIRNLRKLDARAKIIAVSGAANFYDIDQFKVAKEAGADAIVRKLDPLERVVIEANTLLSRAA
jgi:two-component system, chemotaxis family, chemotaxis protein CheY